MTARSRNWTAGLGVAMVAGALILALVGQDQFYAYVFVATFVVGARSTYRLARTYRHVRETLPNLRRLALQAFVVVSFVCTATAAWFGIITARRLLGYDPLDGSQFVSLILASAILLVPLYLDTVVDVIASAEDEVR